MKKLGKALGAVALVGAVAAGGAAFTESNTLPSANVAGYGTVTVTGVTATSVTYTLNAVGDTITAVNLTLTGDTTGDTIAFAFNAENTVACSDGGTYNGTTHTTYVCTANHTVSDVTAFHLVATNTL